MLDNVEPFELGMALMDNYKVAKEMGVEYVRWNITDIESFIEDRRKAIDARPKMFTDPDRCGIQYPTKETVKAIAAELKKSDVRKRFK